MADKNTIMMKVVGTPAGRFKGELVKISPICYELLVTSMSEKIVSREVMEQESYAERVEKLRPFNPDGNIGAAELGKKQKAIDSYLEKVTIPEALADIKGDKDGLRVIEKELKFPVERWIDEKIKVRDVPVQKEVIEVAEKKVTTLDFYFRPSGSQISKSIYNYVKTKNK